MSYRYKGIPEFDEVKVNKLGLIRKFIDGRWRRFTPTRKKGRNIWIWSNGRSIPLHQLVLMVFVGPRPHYDYVACHWDDNPDNNRLDNLRWGTRSQNIDDAIRNGRVDPRRFRKPERIEEMVRLGIWSMSRFVMIGDQKEIEKL